MSESEGGREGVRVKGEGMSKGEGGRKGVGQQYGVKKLTISLSIRYSLQS